MFGNVGKTFIHLQSIFFVDVVLPEEEPLLDDNSSDIPKSKFASISPKKSLITSCREKFLFIFVLLILYFTFVVVLSVG